MTNSILEVQGLRKSFRKHPFSMQKLEVLKGFDFSVEKGKVTGFLGANGAGKTTTIKCLLRLAHPSEGQIRFFGENDWSSAVRRRIGFLPERPYFYEYLTGREFLRFYGQLSEKLKDKVLVERVDKLLDRVGLGHAKDRSLRNFSKGMLQRIGIAQALIHEPDFIILDEPMTGLDPDGRMEVTELIQETASMGTTVFFSSHLLHDAEKLCDNLVIMKLGEVVYQGSTVELLNKVDYSHELVFENNQSEIHTKVASSIEEVQGEIDQLRNQGFKIIEVKNKRLSLEEAFVNIAFGDKND